MSWVRYAAKAVYAGAVTFLGALLAALQASPDVGFGDLPAAAWITIILATIIAVGGVFGLQNDPKPGS